MSTVVAVATSPRAPKSVAVEDIDKKNKFKVASPLEFSHDAAKGITLTWPKCRTMSEASRKRLPLDGVDAREIIKIFIFWKAEWQAMDTVADPS